jgi:DNA-directed RNA polymerase subunit K/omega
MADNNDDDFVGGEDDNFDIAEELEVEGEPEETAKEDPLAALKKRHPECILDYAESIGPKIPLTGKNDTVHRSPPFLTVYERTKIIGFRANQLSKGARPYIPIPEHVTNVSEIARLELKERRLPFIVRRPMPDGSHEYWRLSDLLIL